MASGKDACYGLQGGSDVITKTALKRINWAAYKINQGSDKIGVFVSIVSTKIPYKGAGKEYIGTQRLPVTSAILSHSECHSSLRVSSIRQLHHKCQSVFCCPELLWFVVAADDMDELVHAVKHAIQQCGLQVNILLLCIS